jgi:hypothetical protein
VRSPAGGQDINTDIQDAVALGARLAGVSARAPASAASTVRGGRRPVAANVVASTHRMRSWRPSNIAEPGGFPTRRSGCSTDSLLLALHRSALAIDRIR